jgi:DNA-binding HxlR family transcriptional regulator
VTNTERTTTGWETVDDEQCRRATTVMELVGRRWSGAILLAMGRGASRFSEVAATVEGLSDRMLALRLKELEHAGLLDRTVEPTVPVTVRYRLSPRGRDLLAALQPLASYAGRWEPDPRA